MLLIKWLSIKNHLMLFFSLLKNEEITFLHVFIFVFILYYIGTILLEKLSQKWGVWKEYENGGWPYRGLSIEGGFKPSAH